MSLALDPKQRGRVSWGVACSLALSVALCWSSQARAEAALPSSEELGKVQAALARGAFSEAIDQLELWSDQGVVHPDLSFDRGVAYLGRAESTARRRADLGQAVAAFEEALHANPGDEEAELALERIRKLISERRAKHDGEGVVARPRLLRALLGLLGENVWAGLGAVGSLLLSLGLAARLLSPAHRPRLAGAIVGAVGVLFLALGGGMALAGSRLRSHSSPAVVIVEEARLHDADGRPFESTRGPSTLGEAGDRVPEGALVHVSAARGALLRVEWGDTQAWLAARELRRLALLP